MRIDCHLHTNRLSCCSLIPPERACELAVSRGLDALLLTEHNQYWEMETLATLQAGHPGIKLYSGVEIAMAEGYHLVAIGPQLFRGMVPFLTLGQLKALARDHREDLFLFVAHAFRYDPTPLPTLPKILTFCDGLEMSSINILRGHVVNNGTPMLPDNHALYQQHLLHYNLTPVFNTDGHDEAAVGSIANDLEVSTLPADEVALAHLFKTTCPECFQNQELLADHPLLGSRG
ncbi:MAG TPA: PHP domain-containing protein [Desulfonatronum sp.]|nr:PHP domain-containing protein [Desulfonatronum sp.]